jgi:hypothetical protein
MSKQVQKPGPPVLEKYSFFMIIFLMNHHYFDIMYLRHSAHKEQVIGILQEGITPPGWNRPRSHGSLSDRNCVYFTAVHASDTGGTRRNFHFFVGNAYLRTNGSKFQDCADWSRSYPEFDEFVREYGLSYDVDSNTFHPNMVTLRGSVPLEGIGKLVITSEVDNAFLDEVRRVKPAHVTLELNV